MDNINPEWAKSTIFVHPAAKKIEHERAATLIHEGSKQILEVCKAVDDKVRACKMLEETRVKTVVDDAILNPSDYVRTRMHSPGLSFMDKGDV